MPNSAMHPARLWLDGIVLLLYFLGIVGIGLWAGRRNRTLTDFALGGRSIPWWAVLASIIAAETSAATFLGAPAEGFKTRSFIYAQLTIGTILARIIIAFTFIRPYYRYGVQSIYEFLEIRFGPWTKNVASGIFLFTRVLGIGVRLYLGGVIIKVIWQYLFPSLTVNIWIYFWGILFVTFLTTIYTAVGGIKAVVWTDFIQASLMIGSMIFAAWLLVRHIPGGLATVTERLGGFPAFFQTGLDFGQGFGVGLKKLLEEPYTLFSAFIASTFLTMATHGTDQDNVQRMLTAKDFQKSRLSLILSGLADLPIAFGFLLVGILLSVYYDVMPDLHLPAADNEIFAYYIVTQMPVGIRGLIIAGVFATMMGSTSAALNALATSFTKDFYLPYFKRAASQKSPIYAARVATVVFGVLMVAVATLAAYAVLRDSKLTIIPLALQSFGYAYGSLLAVFLLGMLTKRRGRDETNVMAMMLGVAAVLVFCKVRLPAINLRELAFAGRLQAQDWAFGSWLPDWWPVISFPWWVLVGCLVCFAVSFIFATPRDRVMMAERHVTGRDDQVKSPVSR
ncbi:MAG: sodium:solute symporter [Verrucomicrobia bacterium]|nr:sodium:solute symporter [Verrucomicrobiota bacterium]